MVRHVPISVGRYESATARQTPQWFRFKARTRDGGIHLLCLDHESPAWSHGEAV